MVDLVKIRNKAKKKNEEKAKRTPEPLPESATAAAVAAEPDLRKVAVGVREHLPLHAKQPAAKGGGTKPERPPIPPAEPLSTQHSALNTPSKLERFKEEAGKRREEITAVTAGEISEQQLELLTFVIAAENYAVDIERIVEIVTPRPITHVPNADASIVGIISLRGTIVTLVDVRHRLRHPPAAGAVEDRRIIVIDHHDEVIGFEVDRVLRVIKINAAAVEPHPVVHASEQEEAIRGVFRHASALTILLDLDKLLEHKALPLSAA